MNEGDLVRLALPMRFRTRTGKHETKWMPAGTRCSVYSVSTEGVLLIPIRDTSWISEWSIVGFHTVQLSPLEQLALAAE